MGQAAAETMQSDHPCAKCGYSLRTLRVDGLCPECGFSVEQSLLSAEDRLVLVAEDRVLVARPVMIRWRKRMLITAGVAVLVFIVGPFFGQYVVPEQAPSVHFDLWFLLWALIVYSALFVSVASVLAWYGCGVRLDHAKYVESARGGDAEVHDERGHRRNDRIARREDIYRRNIGAAKALAVLAVMALMCMAATTIPFFDDHAMSIKTPFVIQIVSFMHWIAILSILIWINAGRLAHAKSVRLQRKRARGLRAPPS